MPLTEFEITSNSDEWIRARTRWIRCMLLANTGDYIRREKKWRTWATRTTTTLWLYEIKGEVTLQQSSHSFEQTINYCQTNTICFQCNFTDHLTVESFVCHGHAANLSALEFRLRTDFVTSKRWQADVESRRDVAVKDSIIYNGTWSCLAILNWTALKLLNFPISALIIYSTNPN